MKQIVERLKLPQEKLKSSGKENINLTDEDAQFQKNRSRIISGYRVDIAVDFQKQIIVANDVTTK